MGALGYTYLYPTIHTSLGVSIKLGGPMPRSHMYTL